MIRPLWSAISALSFAAVLGLPVTPASAMSYPPRDLPTHAGSRHLSF